MCPLCVTVAAAPHYFYPIVRYTLCGTSRLSLAWCKTIHQAIQQVTFILEKKRFLIVPLRYYTMNVWYALNQVVFRTVR